MGTCKVCGWLTSSRGISSTIPTEARIFGRCSRRTSNLRRGYCHGAKEIRRYLGYAASVSEKLYYGKPVTLEDEEERAEMVV
jgi:hypothetical protein